MSLKNLPERRDRKYHDLLMCLGELYKKVEKLENVIRQSSSKNDTKQNPEREEGKEFLKDEDSKLFSIKSELNEHVTIEDEEDYITFDEFEDNWLEKYVFRGLLKKRKNYFF